MKNTIKHFLQVNLLIFCCCSCGRYLDLKPVRQVAVPDRLEDLQALLDNSRMINGNHPGIMEGMTDNYYSTNEDWNSSGEDDRNIYVWHPRAQSLSAWNVLYQGGIYYANIVLDQLETMSPVQKASDMYNPLKGAALFHRAYNFFIVAQLYCAPYSRDARNEPGIPLRTTGAIAVPVQRSTVQETYDRIIEDLQSAASLLPAQTILPTRPNQAAAYGALARVYLCMGDYPAAFHHADLALSHHGLLEDLNTVPTGAPAFKRFNKETIFYSYCAASTALMYAPRGLVDTLLYQSYAAGDIRKTLYFRAGTGGKVRDHHFDGFEDPYGSNEMLFTGIMSSEQYLIRAECHARLGRYEEAMDDLNKLLIARFDHSEPFSPLTATDAGEALEVILSERRKELVNRGLRWMDLRRLNVQGAGISLTRKLGSDTYTLPPGDPRWTLLIPNGVITRSDIEQNAR